MQHLFLLDTQPNHAKHVVLTVYVCNNHTKYEPHAASTFSKYSLQFTFLAIVILVLGPSEQLDWIRDYQPTTKVI